jgi:DNA primase
MSGTIDGYARIKNEIIKRIDIVSVIERYVPSLKKAGSSHIGLCPFHNEKTPSFSIKPNGQNGGYYHCFGCQKSGDVFNFIMEKEGLSFPEALKSLAAECGVLWDIKNEESNVAYSSSTRTNLLKATEFATSFFYDEMTKSDDAKSYFKNRGISGETAKEFRLGFAPNSYSKLLLSAKKAGIGEDLLIETALVKKNENGIFDFFRNRVIFPIFDNSGRPIAFGGRAFGDEKPKYLNSSNTPLYDKSRIFYGYFQAQKEIKLQKAAILVEGYMDMISLYQNGIKNVIAPCGTSFSQEHAVFLSRIVEKAIIVFDGDDAGINGAEKIAEKLLAFELDVRYVLIPEKQDPDDFVKKNGKENFAELVKNSQEGFSFFMERIEKRCNISTPAGKSRALKEILNLLTELKNQIILSDFITKISTRWKIPVSEIKRNIFNSRKGQESPQSGVTGDFQDEYRQIFYTEEGKTIHLFFWYPEILHEYLYEIPDDFFTDALVNKLYYRMKNGEIDRDGFSHSEILDNREKRFLTVLAQEEPAEDEANAKIQVWTKIKKFRKIDLQKKNEALKIKIREESDEKKRVNMLAELALNQKEISALQNKKMES